MPDTKSDREVHVEEISRQEGRAMLDRAAREALNLSADEFLAKWDAGDYDSIRATLSVSADRLARAGAEFFICPDNTAHLALERPGPDLALPGLHIAEVVAGQAASDGRARVGVLGPGTRWRARCTPGRWPPAGSPARFRPNATGSS